MTAPVAQAKDASALPSRLESVLAAGAFAFTAEVVPPLSADPEHLLARARPLAGLADAVNVTDGAAGRTSLSSLAAAALLVAHGIEPVLQMTCRDRNRMALAGDLLGAAALGVRNVLVLRGDAPAAGHGPAPRPVFELDSAGLLRLASGMAEDGVLPSGRRLLARPRFFLGCADVPAAEGWTPAPLRAKAEAGARFVQTQFCYDLEVVRAYAARLRDAGLGDRLSVLVGLGPVSSARSARWMRENLWGAVVPEALVERLARAPDPRAEGIRLCVELVQRLAEIPGIAGVHLMAPGAGGDALPEVIERSGLLETRGGERALGPKAEPQNGVDRE